MPFLAAALDARLEKLPLETWPPWFFAVALWMREASELVIWDLAGALGVLSADMRLSFGRDCCTRSDIGSMPLDGSEGGSASGAEN